MKDINIFIQEKLKIGTNTKIKHNNIDKENTFDIESKIKEIKEYCPIFWSIVNKFCKDKNTEEGIEWLIAAWTCEDMNQWKKYEKNNPFYSQDIKEFEEKYLTDEAVEELDKLKDR